MPDTHGHMNGQINMITHMGKLIW